MSWFDTAGFASLAKSALKEAQKTFDKALDLEPEEKPAGHDEKDDQSESFFAAFGLGPSSSAGDASSSSASGGAAASSAGSLWGALNAVSLIKPQSGGDEVAEVASFQTDDVITAPPHSRVASEPAAAAAGRAGPLPLLPRTPSPGDVSTLLVESPAGDGFSSSVLVVGGDWPPERPAHPSPEALDTSSPCLPASTPESIEILDEPAVAQVLDILDADPDISAFARAVASRDLPAEDAAEDVLDASDSTATFVGDEPSAEESLHSSNSSCHTLVAASVGNSGSGMATLAPAGGQMANSSPEEDSSNSSESFVRLGVAVAVSNDTSPDVVPMTSSDVGDGAVMAADEGAGIAAVSDILETIVSDALKDSVADLKVDAWAQGDWGSVMAVLSPSDVEVMTSPEQHDRPATSSSEPKTSSDIEVVTSPDVEVVTSPDTDVVSPSDVGVVMTSPSAGALTSPDVEVVTSPDEVEVITSPDEANLLCLSRSATLTRSGHHPSTPLSSATTPTHPEEPCARRTQTEDSSSSSFTDVVSSHGDSIEPASSSLATESRGDRREAQRRQRREESDTPPREPWAEQPSSGSADSNGRGASPHESGATSADELETATSSDVEVLTSPANETRHLAAPLRRRPGPQDRADTPSSEGSHHPRGAQRDAGHQRNLSQTSVASSDLDPESERAARRAAELQEVLAAREAKMVELSRLNVTLQEENSNMQSRLQLLEMRLSSAPSGNAEKQQLTADRDRLQRELQEWRRRCGGLEAVVSERDTTITELREEGEKLSKEQLKLSNVIKKLRAKEKEQEAAAKKHDEKVAKLTAESAGLTEQLTAVRESEREQRAAQRQLSSQLTRLEREAREERERAESAKQTAEALEQALQTAHKESADLERRLREQDSEAAAQALSAEIQAKQQVELTLADYKNTVAREREDLLAQLEDLRTSLRRAERESARQEDSYKADASDLQRRLLEAERRNQQLADSVAMATQPLLRQVETLQAALSTQQQGWERAERALTEKNAELQHQLASVSERERRVADQYAEACARTGPLQETVAALRTERGQLNTRADAAEAKLREVAAQAERTRAEHQSSQRSLLEQLQAATSEKEAAERHLEAERTALLAERARNAALQQQVRGRGRLQSQPSQPESSQHGSELSTPRTSPTPSLTRLSFSSSFHELGGQSGRQTITGDGGWETPGAARAGSSLYETLRAGQGAATVVESLTAQLKQKDGELQHLRVERAELEAARQQLSGELARLSQQLETAEQSAQQLQQLTEQFQQLQAKYNALLQMYGEKAEECEELRLDLTDVKDMYKYQIDHLTRQLGEASRS